MGELSTRERWSLAAIAVVGLVALNGAFVYGILWKPDSLGAALRNPVALAFMGEAMVLMALSAYLLHRTRVTRLGTAAFIALSFIGGLAFSIPVALLMPRRGRGLDATLYPGNDPRRGLEGIG